MTYNDRHTRSPKQVAVLDALSPETPRTVDEVVELVAQQSPGTGKWSVYRTIQELEAAGLVTKTPYPRGKQHQYISIIQAGLMPYISPFQAAYSATGAKVAYPVVDYAKAAPDSYDYRFTSEFGANLGQLGVLLLDLFTIATSAKNGDEFDMKAFQETRSKMMTIRQQARWLADVIDNVLRHPSLNGDSQEFIDVWANDADNPIELEEVREIQYQLSMKRAREATSND